MGTLGNIRGGSLSEIVAMNQLDARYYWRHPGNEVDLISGQRGEIVVEVKYGPKAPLNFHRYAEVRDLEKAIVLTHNSTGSGLSGDIPYTKVPVWALGAGAKVY